MLLELLLLLTALGLRDGTALDLAVDVRAVALAEEPLFDGDDGRQRTAMLLAVWTMRESAGKADAIGDKGAACSCLQMHEVARQGVTCAALMADRRLALATGLAWMRKMRDACGSVPAGLRAYSAGICSGSPRARDLVRARCALIGGC